ncbi:hypothetical protein A2G06_16485 (plasmid) [Geobacter anodireducens]|nr:hypothetical protein A2G06_16485 [Geobacter anodireducens]
MINIFRYFKLLSYLFLFFVVGILVPLEIKEISPKSWGWLEGKLGWDMTGFWFTPLGGNGNCRIVNSKEAFRRPGSRVIFGEISPPDRKPYPHLWVEENGEIIDEVCPPGQLGCSARRQFATVNPVSLQLEERSPQSEKDRRDIRWGIRYLLGLKAALEGNSIRTRPAANDREAPSGTGLKNE